MTMVVGGFAYGTSLVARIRKLDFARCYQYRILGRMGQPSLWLRNGKMNTMRKYVIDEFGNKSKRWLWRRLKKSTRDFMAPPRLSGRWEVFSYESYCERDQMWSHKFGPLLGFKLQAGRIRILQAKHMQDLSKNSDYSARNPVGIESGYKYGLCCSWDDYSTK